MKKYLVLLIVIIALAMDLKAQEFVHPGGLHTQADLDRMKAKVADGVHPWIDGWNKLIQDPLAQHTYVSSPKKNMNLRQLMSRDAHAAYLNAIRWYISGDERYAECAIRILNDYSSTLNQIPSGENTEFVGLGGIGISELAMGAEIMRIYDGWDNADFDRFKKMMVDYLYPVCHDFLTNHNGRCIDYYWANWDANNIVALIAIGVLCDNTEIFNEGIEYFKNGAGTGSIKHAVPYIHAGGLGQWQESGRDQEHGQLGVGLLGTACQIAWNQGIDLYGYDNNRLLAGAEYVAKYNQMQEVPFKFYNNCQPSNHKWPAINGRGRLDDRPVWEMLYNHYVIKKGLKAPYTQRMAELMRPEHGSKDHFGYGTLTFTLEEAVYPPHPAPGAPSGLNANASTGRVLLSWQAPNDFTTTGYVVQRSTSKNGPFTTIDSWDDDTYAVYSDKSVINGTTYYYRVAAVNQSGTGPFSSVSSATPKATEALPSDWSITEIGIHDKGNAQYTEVGGGTFVVNGYGENIGNTTDNVTFVYSEANGNATVTGRIIDISGRLAKAGLMIRESLKAGSKTVTMTLGEGGGRFARMGYRSSTDQKMSSTLGNTYTWIPAWFRIERSDDKFTVFESSDGQTWFEVDSVNIEMSSFYYIGMVVCSGNGSERNTIVFDNLKVKGEKNQ